ncbi:hypothetical protein TSAR_004762 [Trichomalopsis sarcophagae]|uniref:Uncharacterized protein n=1 Tax=Trichomalopsis sarcophagae TaxID=543379 RepID=A0A232FK01_9HYME|nr:hypothetical protein TSAR_004762 [Trichomalopsis sarcophagae]
MVNFDFLNGNPIVIFLFWVAKVISKSSSQFNKIYLRNSFGNAIIEKIVDSSCTISRGCVTVTSNLTCSQTVPIFSNLNSESTYNFVFKTR